MKNFTLSCWVDLDGVLTDFPKRITEYTGKTCEELSKDKKTFYKIIAAFPVEFWSEMHWLHDGKTLWKYLTDNYENIKILSTPSEPWRTTNNKSIIGKTIWIKRELKLNDDKIVLSDRKEQFVKSKNDVLIDDRINNISKWVGKGGTGIHHVSAWNTIEKLKLL